MSKFVFSVSFVLLLALVACSNSAADSNTTSAAIATTTANGVGGSGGAGGDGKGGGTTSVGGHHHDGGAGGSVSPDPGHDGGKGGSATTTKPGTGGAGGSEPADATTSYKIVFSGNPAGSHADVRVCMGSPVAKGDMRDDTKAQFLPWPSQSKTSDPVANLATWLDLGSAVVDGSGAYSVQTPPVWSAQSFRFQCYDWKSGQVTFGCVNPDNDSVSVKGANGDSMPYTLVDNLTVKGMNCQVGWVQMM